MYKTAEKEHRNDKYETKIMKNKKADLSPNNYFKYKW